MPPGVTYVLERGCGQTLELRLPSELEVETRQLPPGLRADALPAAVAQAVDHPLEFPPLHQAIVPGDRVVIAVEHGIPQAAVIADQIARCLTRSGATNITVLYQRQPPTSEGESSDRGSASAVAPEPSVPGSSAGRAAGHASGQPDQMSYLAATESGQAIYLNRQLCDADVVVPVGLFRSPTALANRGIYGGLYPALADADARRRFAAPSSATNDVQRRRRQRESAEVAWLLGVNFTIQVIPGRGDSAAHIVAGAPEAVGRRCHQLFSELGTVDLSGSVDLVIGAIGGERASQTWSNVGQAFHSACQVCRPQGMVALCTSVNLPPERSLQRLAEQDSPSTLHHRLQRDRDPDATAAAVLTELRERYRLYLMSDLPATEIESLGIGAVTSARDIERLARQSQRCLIWSDVERGLAVEVHSSL